MDGSIFGKYVVHTSRSRGDRASNRDGFDCGFLVPKGLNQPLFVHGDLVLLQLLYKLTKILIKVRGLRYCKHGL